MLNTPVRVLIVDDEAPARRRLRELLGDCSAEVALTIAAEAADGHEALGVINDQAIDIALVDIRMPTMDGLEFAQHVQKLATPPAIIFTTAYDTYAVKAFELNAVDYLLKPIRRERLAAALKKAQSARAMAPATIAKLRQQARTHLSVNERGRIVLVPVQGIAFLRAELKYLTVRTVEREFLIEESLVALEEEFADIFVRIHRNCLIAKKFVAGFDRVPPPEGGDARWEVVLHGIAERLPVSRRQQHVVRELSGR